MLNSQQHKLINKRKTLYPKIFIILILVLIVWVNLIKNEQFANWVDAQIAQTAFAASGVQQGAHQVSQYFKDLFRFNSIRNEYYRLKSIETLLKKREAEIDKSISTNQNSSFNLIECKALLSDVEGTSGIFIINKGKNDGFKEGMNVIIDNKVLVGKIIEVLPRYSKVESIYNPKTTISVIDLRSSEIGLAKYDNKGFLKLTLYSNPEQFQIGDVLVTSLENKDFLQGLLVGKITSITATDVTAQKNIFIEPFFKLPFINTVYVITDYP